MVAAHRPPCELIRCICIGTGRRYVDFPITDVLQMMGRAGRPQYDQHGVAVIMVADAKKSFYKKVRSRGNTHLLKAPAEVIMRPADGPAATALLRQLCVRSKASMP